MKVYPQHEEAIGSAGIAALIDLGQIDGWPLEWGKGASKLIRGERGAVLQGMAARACQSSGFWKDDTPCA